MNAHKDHAAELEHAMTAVRAGLHMMDRHLEAEMSEDQYPESLDIRMGQYGYEIHRRASQPGTYDVYFGLQSAPGESTHKMMTKKGLFRYVFGNKPFVDEVMLNYDDFFVYMYRAPNYLTEHENARRLRRIARRVRDAANNPHTEFGQRVLRRRFSAAARANAALFH